MPGSLHDCLWFLCTYENIMHTQCKRRLWRGSDRRGHFPCLLSEPGAVVCRAGTRHGARCLRLSTLCKAHRRRQEVHFEKATERGRSCSVSAELRVCTRQVLSKIYSTEAQAEVLGGEKPCTLWEQLGPSWKKFSDILQLDPLLRPELSNECLLPCLSTHQDQNRGRCLFRVVDTEGSRG